jgi:hypothetical protein
MQYPTDLREQAVDTAQVEGRQRLALMLGAVGLLLGLVVVGGAVSVLTALSNGNDSAAAGRSAWLFGLNTFALGTVKVSIALILTTIVMLAWRRADAMRNLLVRVAGGARSGARARGLVRTTFGTVNETVDAPAPLLIHRMARALWAPMLLMGVMAVAGGLLVSFVWSGEVGTQDGVSAAAWTQGLQFLGEGLLLAGISFLLGTVLYALRAGGGEAQEVLGVPVQTLRMPSTAKFFVALMALGLMVAMGQFVGYLLVANGTLDAATAFPWLGPLREVGLGLLLSGIVLALATIARVVAFQFDRVTTLVHTSR